MNHREQLIEKAAKAMHDAYETAAVREGWETQERSRKPWDEVPEANRRTMLIAVEAALAVFEEANTPTGPAYIDIMPPSPETSKRWWSMYCRECGIEEGMADSSDDERLLAQRDEHNRRVHIPTDDELEALRREFEYRIRTAVAYGAMKGYRALPSQVRADWIQHEIDHAMGSRAVAGFHRTVQGEPKHDESCGERCNHCSVCGESILYGSRCPAHYLNQVQGEPSDAAVAISELEREIPDAYVDGSGEPVLVLTERSAKTALVALRAAAATEGGDR